MSTSSDLRRAYDEDRKARRRAQTEKRMARFQILLEHPDVILVRRLGDHGYRLIHFERPQREYVDFWPSTSTVRTWDGKSTGGWVQLLKLLGLPRGPWERPPVRSASAQDTNREPEAAKMKRILTLVALLAISACDDTPTTVVLKCWRPVYELDSKASTLTLVDSIYTCETLR